MKAQKWQNKRKIEKPLTNQGFLFIMLVVYEKTLTKTVGYISKSKRVRDGESLIRVEYI